MENMTRRELLALAIGGGLGALWSPAPGVARMQAADTWKRGYDAARTSNPYLLGWQNADRDRYASDQLSVYGRWPRDLAGTFYRNGPAGHEVGGRRYHHWFDGDGLVQAFHISADGIRHLGRFVETAKRRSERDADRMLWPAFGTSLDGGLPVSHPDTINTANISILHHAGELLALWEAGSPHRLDPQSLETLGIKTWRPDLRGAPFTAHPKVEPDGTVWAFGYALDRGLLVLYRINAGGKVDKADTVEISPLGMIHDFAVTANSLVFVIPPLVFDPERVAPGVSFLDTHVWRPELGTRVLAVDKEDFSRRRWWQSPTGFAYHLGNAWEEGENVHFDYCVAPDATELTQTFREVMRGVWRPPTEPTRFAQVTLGAGDAVEQHVFDRQAEFPRVAPGVVAARHRYVYSLAGPLAKRFRWRVTRSRPRGALGYGDGRHGRLRLRYGLHPGGAYLRAASRLIDGSGGLGDRHRAGPGPRNHATGGLRRYADQGRTLSCGPVALRVASWLSRHIRSGVSGRKSGLNSV